MTGNQRGERNSKSLKKEESKNHCKGGFGNAMPCKGDQKTKNNQTQPTTKKKKKTQPQKKTSWKKRGGKQKGGKEVEPRIDLTVQKEESHWKWGGKLR